MQPLKLKIVNLFAYDEVEIDFTKYRESILIKGRNNSGKSAIIDCISFILYDALARLSRPSSEIIRKGEIHGYGIFVFKVGKTKYRITRGRKKDKPYCKLENLTKNKILSERKGVNTNDKIVSIIGMNFEIFRNSIMFGQGDTNRFVNIKDAGRKAIFCGLIKKLDEVKRDYDTIKKISDAKEDKLNELLITAGFPEKTERNIEYDKKAIKSLNKAKEKYERQLAKLEKKIGNIKSVDKLKKKHNWAERKLHEYKQDLYREKHWSTSDGIIEKTTERINKSEKEIGKIEKGECPTCKRPWPNKKGKHGSDSLLYEERLIIKKNLEWRNKAKRSKKKYIKLYKRRIKEWTKKEKEAKFKLDKSARKEQKDSIKKFKKINNKISNCQGQIKYIEESLKNFKKQLKKELKSQDKIKKLTKEVSNYSVLETALCRTGIQQDIIDDLIPVFEEKVKFYLKQLCDGITVRFVTTVKSKDGKKDIDRFSILIYNGKDEVNISLIGGGIKKRIQIAISFALSDFALEQSGISTEFILLDEMFGDLDDIGRDSVIKLLRNLRKRFKKMLIISHISEIQDLIKDHIEVSQENGVSKIA